MTRSILVLALAMLACPAMMAQANEPQLVTNDRGLTETVMTMRVRGDLTFGPDGVVKEHHIATKLDPKMAEYVDKTIGKLKFRPYLQDGVPVNAKTYFQMTLAARAKDADRYELSMDNAYFTDDETFGDRKFGKNAPTKCIVDCMLSHPPAPSYSGGANGGVIVDLYLNPDGTVADAVVGQSALYSVRGSDLTLNDARKVIEKIALTYAKNARFAPGSGSPLVGDNHQVGALPFVFQMEGPTSDNLGKWRLEQRGKRNIASWLANDPDRWVGVSDTSGGGFMAMKDSPYKLVPNEAHTP
ncbi:hypothetical protein Lysil_0192 [Lysobacter silvestris]|uniref:TonB C-terminal domain-containing protein n=2 Tax=Solilutibacter silvestris TaxID=1645665 RepID=A0A2K1Q0K5_9GAMM|nr:hypothetical protein Lysil_0192 [Lysobacter silvestris]